MILIWGIATDGPLEMVRKALLRTDCRTLFLDQQLVLHSKIDLTFDGQLRGRLETPDWAAELESIGAIYLRPYDSRRVAAFGDANESNRKYQRTLRFEDALMCWIEMTPALVVNKPSAMSSNNSKPYQLPLIRSAGFDVPETLVTTDPRAALDFWNQYGSVIYKSVSGVRSIVTRLGPEHRDRMCDIAHCPTQLQQYVAGTDFRVHVVGEKIFSCEISSNADDYRYAARDDAPIRIRACEIPEQVADRCRKLAAALSLAVAGIDLRRSTAGNWYCFEVNPSPGFSFYQEETGQPIAEAVASLLVESER